MAELASGSGCPLAVHADGNVGTIRSLISAISDRGVKNLLIDPGCGFGETLRGSLDNMTMIRTSAISGDDSLLGHPLDRVPGNPLGPAEIPCRTR